MILISLDIDGVLYLYKQDLFWQHNAELQKKYAALPTKTSDEIADITAVDLFDQQAVAHLNYLIQLIENSGEKVAILLHSNWRINVSLDYLKNLFKQHLFSEKIIDKIADTGKKADLIQKWVAEHEKEFGIKDYIILDDQTEDFPIEHLVLCNEASLFGKPELKKAFELLKRTITVEYKDIPTVQNKSQSLPIEPLAVNTVHDKKLADTSIKAKPVKEHIFNESVVWSGDVLPGHLLESKNGTITVKGKVRVGGIVKAKYNLTIEGDAEDQSHIESTAGPIYLERALNNVYIKSHTLLVKLRSLGNHCTIEAGDYVLVKEDIGIANNITTGLGVEAKNIGSHTHITAQGDVTADIIGEQTVILAQGRVQARRIEEKAYVRAEYDVQIAEFAAESADIDSGNHGVVTVNWQFRSNKRSARLHSTEIDQAQVNLTIPAEISIKTTLAGQVDSFKVGVLNYNFEDALLKNKQESNPTSRTIPLPKSKENYQVNVISDSHNVKDYSIEYLPNGKEKIITTITAKDSAKPTEDKHTHAEPLKKVIPKHEGSHAENINLLTKKAPTPHIKKVKKNRKQKSKALENKDTTQASVPMSYSTVSSYLTTSSVAISRSSIFNESKSNQARDENAMPTVQELNDILEIPNLVKSVEKGSPILKDAFVIRYNMGIDIGLYEKTLKQKLLKNIPGIPVEKCSLFTETVIKIKDYEKFMANFKEALNALKKPALQM